jgi:hypothetical protein
VTRWACQRSRVLGETSRSRRSCVGSSLLSALSKARSTHVSAGLGLHRRGMATSCRSTRISTSLAALDRASSASQLNTRASVRYVSRKTTASEHAREVRAGCGCGGWLVAKALIRRRDRVLGTPHTPGSSTANSPPAAGPPPSAAASRPCPAPLATPFDNDACSTTQPATRPCRAQPSRPCPAGHRATPSPSSASARPSTTRSPTCSSYSSAPGCARARRWHCTGPTSTSTNRSCSCATPCPTSATHGSGCGTRPSATAHPPADTHPAGNPARAPRSVEQLDRPAIPARLPTQPA